MDSKLINLNLLDDLGFFDWFSFLILLSILGLIVILISSFWINVYRKGKGFHLLNISGFSSLIILLATIYLFISIDLLKGKPDGGEIIIFLPFVSLVVLFIFLTGLIFNDSHRKLDSLDTKDKKEVTEITANI